MGNYALLLLAFAAVALLIVIAVVIAIIRTPYFLARLAMAGMLFLSVAAIVVMVLFAGKTVNKATESRPITDSYFEETKPAIEYAYDFGEVKKDVAEEDVELFYTMVQMNLEKWEGRESFVSAELDAQDTVSGLLFSGSVSTGLFRHWFTFSEDYVRSPHAEEPTTEEEFMITVCRFKAADVDWALKALFDVDPVHFEWSREADAYYEGDYFYHAAHEQYMGNPGSIAERFEADYEEIGNGTYRFVVNATTRFEYDEETEDYTWEFEAVPMESRDMGTYWRILSFTQK